MARTIPHWREKYPVTIHHLEGALPDLHLNSPAVWQAFLDASRLDHDGGLRAVTITDTEPLIWFADLGRLNGFFDPQMPTRVQICGTVAERFERDAALPEAREFMVSKILHETVHWARHKLNIPEIEEAGEAFEERAYGQTLRRYWEVLPASRTETASARAERLRIALSTPAPGTTRPDVRSELFTASDVTANMPRGIRNNNPGNIKLGQDWRGLAGPDEMKDFQRREAVFCVFKEPEWGIRAMMRILRNYQEIHNLTTIATMIGRWAPPGDNNRTDSYARFVAEVMNIQVDRVFEFLDPAMSKLMLKAMINMENGIQPYKDIQFDTASALV